MFRVKFLDLQRFTSFLFKKLQSLATLGKLRNLRGTILQKRYLHFTSDPFYLDGVHINENGNAYDVGNNDKCRGSEAT